MEADTIERGWPRFIFLWTRIPPLGKFNLFAVPCSLSCFAHMKSMWSRFSTRSKFKIVGMPAFPNERLAHPIGE